MRNRMTYLRTLRRKASVTVKAHYRLSDGSAQVMILGNSYNTWREQMDEYEDWGRRTDLSLVELYWCPERFVKHGLKWCTYDSYQAELDVEAKNSKRGPRQLAAFEWTRLVAV
jgi:hypothetical protein